MENTVNGIHHLTAIAGDPKQNFHFYTHVLGLRLVKKTVNFDDPETYHLYYGDEIGTPGTILTFFPWGNIKHGKKGSGEATEIGYSVPEESLGFWKKRFEEYHVAHESIANRFGMPYLSFMDPDGLKLELIADAKDSRLPWETAEVKVENATRGFFNVTITTNKMQPTADILTGVFGYRLLEQEGGRYRFITDTVENASVIDLLEIPGQLPGQIAGGSVHHVAFRVKDEATLMFYREKITNLGLQITDKIDRNYFYSLYFREPGGVLFELATDNPGFSVDEPVSELGSNLKLPAQYEQYRSSLEKTLPKLF